MSTTTSIPMVEQDLLTRLTVAREKYSEAFAAVETNEDKGKEPKLIEARDKATDRLHKVADRLRERGYVFGDDDHDDAVPHKDPASIKYEASSSEGVKATAVQRLIVEYQEAKGTPIVFNEACAKAGAKYPQDVEAAMIALEILGKVERLSASNGGQGKRVAFRWVVEEVKAPAKK